MPFTDSSVLKQRNNGQRSYSFIFTGPAPLACPWHMLKGMYRSMGAGHVSCWLRAIEFVDITRHDVCWKAFVQPHSQSWGCFVQQVQGCPSRVWVPLRLRPSQLKGDINGHQAMHLNGVDTARTHTANHVYSGEIIKHGAAPHMNKHMSMYVVLPLLPHDKGTARTVIFHVIVPHATSFSAHFLWRHMGTNPKVLGPRAHQPLIIQLLDWHRDPGVTSLIDRSNATSPSSRNFSGLCWSCSSEFQYALFLIFLLRC